MSHTSIETPHRKRCPMSAEQRTKLSLAQRAYVAHDPRWPEHRRKLAAAQEARRMTLTTKSRRSSRCAERGGPFPISPRRSGSAAR